MKVLKVFLAAQAGDPMEPVAAVRAVPEKGLEGDRYYHGRGTFSRWPGARREVSLISVESLRAIHEESGIALMNGEHRRSIVTEGADLKALIGKRFRVGEALLQGERECLPCGYIERKTQPGALEALRKHGGGLRAFVLEGGLIRPGDEVVVLEETGSTNA